MVAGCDAISRAPKREKRDKKKSKREMYLDRAGDGAAEASDHDGVVGLESLKRALDDCAEGLGCGNTDFVCGAICCRVFRSQRD